MSMTRVCSSTPSPSSSLIRPVMPLSSSRVLVTFLLGVSLSLPAAAALAQQQQPATEAPTGPTTKAGSSRVVLVRDLMAGAWRLPGEASREVSVVHGGKSSPLRPSQPLGPGDAVRSQRGVAELAIAPGTTVQLGEGSQLRIADPLVHRIGRSHLRTQGDLLFEVGGIRWQLSGGRADIQVDSSGVGRLLLLGGRLQRAGEPDLTFEATDGSFGLRIPLPLETPEASPKARPTLPLALALTATERSEVDEWLSERFSALPEQAGPAARRAQLRLAGGMGALLSSNWGAAEVGARFRLGGEGWLEAQVGIHLRPGETDEGNDLYWALPVRLGGRWIRFVDKSPLYFGVGADAQLLVFPGCFSGSNCESGVTLRPGVLAAGVAGLVLSPRIALDLELSGGVHGFATLNSLDDIPVVLPQIGLRAGLVIQL